MRSGAFSWSLLELCEGILPGVQPSDVTITDITLSSREVTPGALFVALHGVCVHGADYLQSALDGGAAALLVERAGLSEERCNELVEQFPQALWVSGGRAWLGQLAERFFGHPSRALKMVGVTGTNGKTSVSHFIAAAQSRLGVACGVIGTLGAGLYGQVEPFGRTTPDAILLSRTLARLHSQGAQCVVMEVSSHGLNQGRVQAIEFDVAVFTNLSHDHLDYHGDMQSYAACKALLFSHTGLKSAVINLDDPFGAQLLGQLPAEVSGVGYSLSGAEGAALNATGLELDLAGIRFNLSESSRQGRVEAAVVGRFNAANLLATAGVLLQLGVDFEQMLTALGACEGVPGRMQLVTSAAPAPLVVVDFAHTPDALEQVLRALREHCQGQLWCLMGCGGGRDQAKRPRMGALAEQFADRVVVTDDNPRGEASEAIIAAIIAGMRQPERAEVIPDRTAAIGHCIDRAGLNDLVLLAGKGHETHQEVAGKRFPFSDLQVAESALMRRQGHG